MLRMKIFCSIILLAILGSLNLFGESNKKVDSLFIELNVATTEKKIDVFIKLARELALLSPDSAEIFANKALYLSRQFKNNLAEAKTLNILGYINYYKGKFDVALLFYDSAMVKAVSLDFELYAQILNNKGVIYDVTGDYKNALLYYNNSLEINIKHGYKKGVADSYNNMGAVYYNKGEYEKAIENYQKSLKVEEDLGNKKGIAITLYNIGEVFFDMKNFDLAQTQIEKAIIIFKQTNDQINLSNAYNDLGEIYSQKGDLNSAIMYYSNALHIATELNKSTSYFHLGLAYKTLNKFDIAMNYFQKALEHSNRVGQKQLMSNILKNIGDVHKHFGNFNQAIECYHKSKDLARDADSKNLMFPVYRALSDVFLQKNDYRKAYENYVLYADLKDSVLNEENFKRINEIQTKYETEKKEKELVLLSKENEVQKLKITKGKKITIASFGFIVFIAVISVLFIRQYRLRQKQKSAELEQRLLRAQMNPHFIFNSLIAIQNYILKNKSLEAGEYLSDFAVLMRSILDNSRKEFVSLESELEFLNHYLTLQQMRFRDKFDYKIDVSEGIELEETAIPPMLAQPFIENSIEHGFTNKDEKGMINVRFFKENGSLIFELKDNGIGREQAQKHKKKHHESFATEITTKRIENLNKHSKKKYIFTITDLKSEQGYALGTKVTFKIPLFYI